MPVGSAPGAACPGVGECLFPRWRAVGSIMWRYHDWSAMWRFQYLGGVRMGSPAPSQDVQPAGRGMDGFYIDYGSYICHDLTATYTGEPPHSRISLGVNNL